MNQYSEKYVDQLEVQIAEQQAEIERLSNDNYKFIKAMANKDRHIESLKQLLNDSALRKAQEK
jgi:wobble nucleotide-excising tRNase